MLHKRALIGTFYQKNQIKSSSIFNTQNEPLTPNVAAASSHMRKRVVDQVID